jgi:Putative beta barrel porin-7 (BBP7)
MRNSFLISALTVFAAAGSALAQAPASDVSPYNPPTSGSPSTESAKKEGSADNDGHAKSLLLPSAGADGQGTGTPCKSYDDGGKVCGPDGRVWVSAEYLLWWAKDSRVPPLVTTGPANPRQVPPPGALGAVGTSALFSGESLNDDPFSGGRFTAGYWLNCSQTTGVEASYFFLGQRSGDFRAVSSGAPGSAVIARPFFDVSTGLPNSELIAFPGLAGGTVQVHSTTRLQGPEANLIYNLCCSCDCCDCCQSAPSYRWDLLGGFRYLDLRDGMGVVESTQVLPGAPVFSGDAINAFDQFDTRNQFYGGQLGVRGEVRQNRLFANITGKVALGDTHQTIDVNGATTITPPGGPTAVRPGGLLALPGNSGRFSRDEFSAVPEVDVNVGCQVTSNLRVFVGYNFLYWSSVVRSGDVIDLRVNSTRVPTSLLPPSGPAALPLAFRNSDFWAQGVAFGAELRF